MFLAVTEIDLLNVFDENLEKKRVGKFETWKKERVRERGWWEKAGDVETVPQEMGNLKIINKFQNSFLACFVKTDALQLTTN